MEIARDGIDVRGCTYGSESSSISKFSNSLLLEMKDVLQYLLYTRQVKYIQLIDTGIYDPLSSIHTHTHFIQIKIDI